MTEKIAGFLDKVLGRRSFLVRMAEGAAALVASVLGFSVSASALYNVACCNLLCPSNSSCPSPCTICLPWASGGTKCGNGAYQWCWSCCNTSDNQTYYCLENFVRLATCPNGCSYAKPTGIFGCAGGGPGTPGTPGTPGDPGTPGTPGPGGS